MDKKKKERIEKAVIRFNDWNCEVLFNINVFYAIIPFFIGLIYC